MHVATLLCPSSGVPLSSFGQLLAELPVSDLQPAGALLPAVEGGPHHVTQHAACVPICHAFVTSLTSLVAAHNAIQCHTMPTCTTHMLSLLIQNRPQPQIAAAQRNSRLANANSLTHCVPVHQSMHVRRLAISWTRCAA